MDLEKSFPKRFCFTLINEVVPTVILPNGLSSFLVLPDNFASYGRQAPQCCLKSGDKWYAPSAVKTALSPPDTFPRSNHELCAPFYAHLPVSENSSSQNERHAGCWPCRYRQKLCKAGASGPQGSCKDCTAFKIVCDGKGLRRPPGVRCLGISLSLSLIGDAY
ncbi:hypothetical protein BS47DRAFT_892547 [Hydnum rufescens UP504]|uniref:Zn(2)-C6 fungal-type domain-containing protein n=1 Tax=Hydnum rufescens UP504 TaxID=1448309 RepID=A0A9P6AYK8_9AGAM|nr:hypothetical protein BS47DRAFT_892547 [Hydnum rufescens UP504]